MAWNFNLTGAREQRAIIAAYPGAGKKRGVTRWLADQDRWEGMTKGQEPVAWQPWPDYPETEEAI
jgi:hypothetical protein